MPAIERCSSIRVFKDSFIRMPNVRLRQLQKIYPSRGKNPAFEAVKSIDLEIRDREFMVLVGPSGCGKTSVLRMIAGLEEITGGDISIGECVVNQVPPKDRDIAMVFQNYALYPHMTVFENMAFGLKLRKFPKKEIAERVQDAAKTLDIEDLLDRKPKALSGGQRQRVAVGRAIVRNPQVFLFDEPLSNLDAKTRVTTRAEISKLHDRLDATMIYVTHDQVEAMTMGNRICVMNEGKIMQTAAPLDLYYRPDNLFVAGFIGSPPMNFVQGRIENGDPGLSFVQDNRNGNSIRVPLTEKLEAIARPYLEQEIILGIRPEDVRCENVSESEAVSAPIEIDVVEPMGSETMLYLRTNDTSLAARASGDAQFKVNQSIRIAFDPEKIHLFDPRTEKAIR